MENMLKQKRADAGEMSERQAERLLEMYENASKNGEEWMHDVLLNRGTEKYLSNIERLNEAFRIKSIDIVIEPLTTELAVPVKKSGR
jgi:hypothetical protein